MLQKSSMFTIKLARKYLGNSVVNRWKVAGWAKAKLFHAAYHQPEREVEYFGARLLIPMKDSSVAPGILGKYYEKVELELFQSLASTSRKILDVGGNIGLYAAVGALAVPASGHVHCFEPVSENISYLKRNMQLNNVSKKVTVVEAAVGDKDGMMKIFLSRDNAGNHSASAETAHGTGEFESVQEIQLDTFTRKHHLADVDILKVDVEGFDGQVLRGANRLLQEQQPTLFVEYIPSLLKRCGFDPNEFVQLLAGTYERCYVVNEPQERLSRSSISELPNLGEAIGNANLILASNPKHIKIIDTWTATKSAND